MSSSGTAQKALELLKAFERAGRPISRVTIEGRKIEIELMAELGSDEFDRIDMRHGQT